MKNSVHHRNYNIVYIACSVVITPPHTHTWGCCELSNSEIRFFKAAFISPIEAENNSTGKRWERWTNLCVGTTFQSPIPKIASLFFLYDV